MADPIGVTFNVASAVQFGDHPDPDGADLWLMTQADNGEVYAAWGDGKGWNVGSTYRAIGITKITGAPPSLSGTDIYGSDVGDYKPTAIIADQSQAMFMYVNSEADTPQWDFYYGATSSDNGASWAYGASVYRSSVDVDVPVGFVQFGSGYTDIPSSVDSAYYYFYLNARAGASGPSFYLGRCLKADIFTRANHQYFSGWSSGSPTWTSTFANRAPILIDVEGMNAEGSFQVWHSPGLQRYIGAKVSTVSTLCMYWAFRPWGPWYSLYHQQYVDSTRKYAFVTPAKWMSADGLSLWTAWSGLSPYDNANFVSLTLLLGPDSLGKVF